MPSGPFARALRFGRTPVVLIITALVASALTLFAAPPAMAAAPSVSASISGGNILAGEPGTFTVSATNPAGADGYNLALFADVPDGVGFISSTLGTPMIYNAANPPAGARPAGTQRWVWEDLSDLPAGGTRTGTVTVSPAQPTAVVGGETNAVMVTYIPAGLEFFGRGAIDNSTVDRGLGDPLIINEFDGVASLPGTPAVAGNCPAPASVETVTRNAADAAAAGITPTTFS